MTRLLALALVLSACGGQDTPPRAPHQVPLKADDPRLVPFPDWAYERLNREEVPLITVVLQLCRDPQGVPNKVTLQRPTPWPELEAYYGEALKPWRKEPVLVQGVAIPTCEPVRFRYLVSNPDERPIPSALKGRHDLLQLSRRLENFVKAFDIRALSFVFRVCAAEDGKMQSMTMDALEIPEDVPAWIEDDYRERFEQVKWPYPSWAPPGQVVCRGVQLNYKIVR